jgi:hypothetical protein
MHCKEVVVLVVVFVTFEELERQSIKSVKFREPLVDSFIQCLRASRPEAPSLEASSRPKALKTLAAVWTDWLPSSKL